MDANERITIRLEPDILSRMDALLERSPAFGSRSHLCRVALTEFLDVMEGESLRVSADIPRAYLELLDGLVDSGYFVDREDAVRRLVERGLSQERVQEIVEHRETMGRVAGTRFPVELAKKDE